MTTIVDQDVNGWDQGSETVEKVFILLGTYEYAGIS
jgi:hypothetical protein